MFREDICDGEVFAALKQKIIQVINSVVWHVERVCCWSQIKAANERSWHVLTIELASNKQTWKHTKVKETKWLAVDFLVWMKFYGSWKHKNQFFFSSLLQHRCNINKLRSIVLNVLGVFKCTIKLSFTSADNIAFGLNNLWYNARAPSNYCLLLVLNIVVVCACLFCIHFINAIKSFLDFRLSWLVLLKIK